MISPYENVKRAIHFKNPEWLPWISSGATTDYKGDIVFLFCEMGYKWWTGKGGRDEWGCLWKTSEFKNMGMVKEHPLNSWRNFPNYKFPNPKNPDRYKHLKENSEKDKTKYYILANGSAMFERAHFLRGFSNVLEDLYFNLSELEKLLDRLVDFQIDTIEYIGQHFSGRIHGIRLTDDWGTQQSLIISLEMWQKIFKPRYKIIFDTIHKFGMDIWLHSCGKVNLILPDLIEIGLDVINLQQPKLLGIEEIGNYFREKICFESNVDIQSTLPKGDFREIKDEIEILLKFLASEKGGFILTNIRTEGNGITEESKQFMIETFRKLDPWRKR